mmetsp:Transcript_91063/g.167123  ORF Transcript_91063/g.167123 Transcript_91063/m.167123 type:complete len:206 (+) Transcript_91063:51-668(+)
MVDLDPCAHALTLEPAFVRLPRETCEATLAGQSFSEHIPAKIYHVDSQINNAVLEQSSSAYSAFKISKVNNVALEETSTTDDSGAETNDQSAKEMWTFEEEMSDLPEAVKASLAMLPLDDIPSARDQESSSIGSIGHHMGACRPCAWRWKPTGCVKAESCEFCHLCEDGVRKTRKKARMSDIKTWKALRKMLPVGRVDPNRKRVN